MIEQMCSDAHSITLTSYSLISYAYTITYCVHYAAWFGLLLLLPSQTLIVLFTNEMIEYNLVEITKSMFAVYVM